MLVLFGDYSSMIKIYNFCMKLLKYTKLLARKIKFYDSVYREPYYSAYNPFATPKENKIIWIENEKDN